MGPRKAEKATFPIETVAELNFACHQSWLAYFQDLRFGISTVIAELPYSKGILKE